MKKKKGIASNILSILLIIVGCALASFSIGAIYQT